MKRFVSRLLLTVLLCPIVAHAQPALPTLATDGFLPEGALPYAYASREEGKWAYVDQTLRVEITRYREGNPEVEWFESFVRCKGDTALHTVFSNQTQPKSKYCIASELSRRVNAVFAINDDYFGSRQEKKQTMGIIIRDKKVYSDKAFGNNYPGFPSLEVLARFEDGSLKVFESSEHTAQEYLDMGATDTYAFGPMLVRAGEIVLKKTSHVDANGDLPRCALGMIAPNHYVVITVPASQVNKAGTTIYWMAERMHELGAVEALNLDGGNTTTLCFLGDLLTRPEKGGKKERTMTSLIVIGTAPDELMLKQKQPKAAKK